MKRSGNWKLAAGAVMCALLLTGCASRDNTLSPAPTAAQSSSPQALNSPAPTVQSMYKDGTYTAQVSQAYAQQNQDWREYVKLTVTGGQVTQVEYDAEKDGKKKRETTQEEYPMTPHPSEWIPEIERQLMRLAGSTSGTAMPQIDGVTGATQSSRIAERLYAAALSAARTGSTQTVTLADDVQDMGGEASSAPADPDNTTSSQ